METINTNYFEDKFRKLQSADKDKIFNNLREEGFTTFNKTGLPTLRNEEWKYTAIGNLFKKEYHFVEDEKGTTISSSDIDSILLPGFENANEIVFVNGIFNPALSSIRSDEKELIVLPLEEAAAGIYGDIIKKHLGKSSNIVKDGIHALNTSFIYGGLF